LDAVGRIIGIENGSHTRERRHRELEKIQPFPDQRIVTDSPRSSDISAGPCDALCKP
jgi:hypothetical protein